MANTYFDTAKITAEATAVAVSTVGSSNVGENSADLEGSLDDLGGNSSVDVSFEYREVGASSWNQTSTINKTATGNYTQTVSGLNSGTDYEFRARGDGVDSGETSTGSTLTFTTQAASARVTGIDDFEDGDLSEYNAISGSMSTQTGTVYEGTYALEGSGNNIIASTSGLPTYPQAGDTFQFRGRFENAAGYILFYFAMQSNSSRNNRYEFQYNDDTGTLKLRKEESNSVTTLASTSVNLSTSTWYRGEIDWGEGGSITATLYDDAGNQLAQVSATDSTFTSGGIGWESFNPNTTALQYYDIAEITDVTSSTGVIDDFEDDDIAEYGGVTGDYTVQSGDAYEGTYAVERTQNTEFGGISSTSGLPRYPQAGDTMQIRMKFLSTDNADQLYFKWAQQGESKRNDGYRAEFDDPNQRILIKKNNSTDLASTTVDFPADEWIRGVLEWADDGTMTVTAYDEAGNQLGQVSTTDTDWSGGGFGVESNNTGGFHDIAEITSTTTDTTETGIIDDYEDNDLSEYSTSASFYTTTSSTVYNGTYAMLADMSNSSGGQGDTLISTSGLPRYPEAGDEFSFWARMTVTNGKVGIYGHFGWQDSNNWYRVGLSDYNSEFTLSKNVGGTNTTLGATAQSYSSNTWYRVRVVWGAGGSIDAYLEDTNGNVLASVSGTDSNFTSGGMGYYTSSWATDVDTFGDYWRII